MFSIKQIFADIKADFQQPVEVATSVDAKPAPDTIVLVQAELQKATTASGEPRI